MKKIIKKYEGVIIKLETVLAVILVFISTLIMFSVKWLLVTWSELTVDEIIYHIMAPLQGTSTAMLKEYTIHCTIPAILAALVVIGIFITYRKKKAYGYALIVSFIAAFFTTGFTVLDAWDDLDIGNYLVSQFEKSSFIDENYVNPRDVKLEFPERKRNLIYLYLESTEVTFADEDTGGAFKENVIPELTKLAMENEDFSGEDNKLNGGYSMPGSTWTMGALFAETSGLPLKISIDKNAMDSQSSFFPDIVTLGDILHKEGYTQEFLLGSVGYFGGRKLYFKSHGDYAIKDYSYWKNRHKFDPSYWVNWGFEDRKLYEYAKEELTELSGKKEPFNLTLLTVDTHFPDGYVCEICKDSFDDQYANVYNCASRQVKEFVDWCRTQDWFEDTTIVISGDHPTMDHDFCTSVPAEYERTVYTAYINSSVKPKLNKRRDYTTFDDFPTTLASMGVKIEGDRLGLGTNLFSDLETLSEKYGREFEKNELEKKSELMVRFGKIDKGAAYESKEAKELKEKEKKAKEEAETKSAG